MTRTSSLACIFKFGILMILVQDMKSKWFRLEFYCPIKANLENLYV